ncbi:zinc ribbon-containing protein [Acinetobacter radioresistens]|jgi:Zinc-ribbon containing domain|uniref:zinc ribbon-containing protein n=1 Tax=Acinetobacter radioresistens TaxID=40216 RepID=UPI00224690E7|nr:hypothetical protein [Acinetobacter radioresistens]MCX0330325.1 zinc ribbon-containing protein [Acinetobacter radioresistens]
MSKKLKNITLPKRHYHLQKWAIDFHHNRVILLRPFSKHSWRTKMVTAGSKPGTGFYFCVQCGHRVYLEIGTDRLPPCTKCYGTQYNDKVA